MRSAIVLLFTIFAVFSGYFLFFYGNNGSTPRAQPNGSPGIKLDGDQIVSGPTIGKSIQRLPDNGIIDQNGDSVSLNQLRGSPVLMSFIYTSCPMKKMCPRITKKMVQVQKRVHSVPDLNVQFVSVSFDPETDTPEVLRYYGKQYDVNFKNWSFWTGNPKTIRTLTIRLRIQLKEDSKKDQIRHNMRTYAIDADGTIRTAWKGSGWSVDQVFREIKKIARKKTSDS